MKGGIFDLSEMFLKILSTASVAIILMAIFFTLNQYHIIYMENKADREALVVGNTVLSSCICDTSGGNAVKGLLSEEKVLAEISSNTDKDRNVDCMKYGKGIYIEIYDEETLLYGFGNSGVCEVAWKDRDVSKDYVCRKKTSTLTNDFTAVLNKTTNIIPVKVTVYLGELT
jgi:hypothetical protein